MSVKQNRNRIIINITWNRISLIGVGTVIVPIFIISPVLNVIWWFSLIDLSIDISGILFCRDLICYIPAVDTPAAPVSMSMPWKICDGYKISSHVKLAKPCKARSRIKLCRPRSLPSLSVLVLIIKGSPKVHVSACLCGDIAVRDTIPILEDYNLRKKLGYFILDNADNNDKCVEYILKKIRPELEFFKHRFRCFGYILNLITQAFLFGTDPDCLATDLFNEDNDPNNYTRKLKK
jgi:hypothetical protein